MSKFGCVRKLNGQFSKINNGTKVVRVQLNDGSTAKMTKDELNHESKNNGLRKYYSEANHTYYLVSEELYYELKRPEWREAKCKERNQKANELSRKKTADSNVKVSAHNETLIGDFYDNAEIVNQLSESPEERLIKLEKLHALHEVLATLSALDREIVTLFSLKYTDAQIGEKIGMSQRGVNKRRKAIFALLKENLVKIYGFWF